MRGQRCLPCTTVATPLPPAPGACSGNEKRSRSSFPNQPERAWRRAVQLESGAGNETRTRDPDLGKVVLYQLSYSRVVVRILLITSTIVKKKMHASALRCPRAGISHIRAPRDAVARAPRRRSDARVPRLPTSPRATAKPRAQPASAPPPSSRPASACRLRGSTGHFSKRRSACGARHPGRRRRARHRRPPGPEKQKPRRGRGFHLIWSGKRDSNSRPQPWQGCALPTELFPR